MIRTEKDNIYRQSDGLLINKDESGYNLYMAERERLKNEQSQKQKIQELENKFNSMDHKLNLILEKLNG